MFDLGIVIPAINCRPIQTERLIESLHEHDSTTCSFKVEIVTDYPGFDAVDFNVAKAKNIGIKKLLPECQVIVAVDTDYIVPAGLVDFTAYETGQHHLWHQRRDVNESEIASRNWTEWVKVQTNRHCWGSWNGLSAANWLRIGGYDERTFGWGGDDDILHARIKKLRIPLMMIDAFPLMHVKHPPRPWHVHGVRSKENMKWLLQPQPNYLA